MRASSAPASAALAVLLAAALLSCSAAPADAHVELVESPARWVTYGEHVPAAPPRGAAVRAVSRVLSPGQGSLRTAARDGNGGKRSKFIITLVDEPTHISVRKAVDVAVHVMENAWVSKVPVRMRIEFRDLKNPRILANGGGTLFCRIASMFKELVPIAAGEAVLGRDLNGAENDKRKYDVLITINSRSAWHVETHERTPHDKYDLVTVLLHEIYHNLIFTGGIFVDGKGDKQEARVDKEFITRFDAFLTNKDGCSVLGYLDDDELIKSTDYTGPQLLAHALTNYELYFGFKSVGSLVELNAPRKFRPKSSVYHLDNKVDGDDKLMSPMLKMGVAIRNIGPKIRYMQDLYLNHHVKGANTRCSRPLRNPIRSSRARLEDRQGITYDENHHAPTKIDDTRIYKAGENVVRNVGKYAFPLAWIIVLSILGVLLLLLLCAVLGCLAYKLSRKKSIRSSISSSDLPPGNVYPPPPPQRDSYRTPSRSKTSSFKGAYPGPLPPPPMGGPSMGGPSMNGHSMGGPAPPMGGPMPPPPIYPSSRRSSSGRHQPSMRPPPHLPSSSRHSSSKRPPSCKPPSRHHSSRAPKTVDYFDCS